jgi:carboxyl-terminal processing protease
MFRCAPSIAGAAVGSALTLFGTAILPCLSRASSAPRIHTAGDYRSLELFDEVFNIVRANYVDKPDAAKLVASSLKAMLSDLDPHSSYMDAQSLRDMEAQTSGKFGGVGLMVARIGDVFKVISSIEDAPAARANIRDGDVITEVNGKPAEGLTLTQIAETLRGPAGTKVELGVIRQNETAPISLTLTRQVITLRSVRHQVEGNNVGYIRISQFDDLTTDELKKAIGDLSRKIPRDRLKGYILDLRNDPGGLLDQAVSVSDAFLKRGEIVSIRGRTKELQRFDATGGDLINGSPLVVLINGGSASASEIVAGALQDHKRAKIIGSQSFGKGSVQTIIPLGKRDGAIRLTTGRYFTPSGRSLQARGVTPDIQVLQTEPEDALTQDAPISEAELRGHLKSEGAEKSGSQTFVPSEPKDDRALQKALGLLRGTDAQVLPLPSRQEQATR